MSNGLSRSEKSTPISRHQAPAGQPPRGLLILMLALISWVAVIGVLMLSQPLWTPLI